MRSRLRFLRPGSVGAVLFLVGLGALFGAGTGTTLALFTGSTSNPGTFTAKRIFPADRITSAWKLADAADGSESDESFSIAFTDAKLYTTALWPNAFNSGKYIDFQLNAPLPAGLSVSAPTFSLGYSDSDNNAGNDVCFYFEVRRASTSEVLATHGSSGSPVDCEAVAVVETVTTSIPSVSTSDIANDLLIRVYMRHSASKASKIERAVVFATAYGTARTLYPKVLTDVADGTAATTTWGVALGGDGASYQAVGNWPNTFNTARYLKLTFPKYVPGSAVITSASFEHAYASLTAVQTCWYFEVYNDTTLIGTHGSSSSPVSCNSTTSFLTDTVSIPEVDTPGEANNVVIKVYAKNSGGDPSKHDLVALKINYSLGDAGCSDPGSQTLTATQDSWIQQDGASADNNFGGDNLLEVKSDATAKNRRALVRFDTLPTIPAGCSFTGATLRMFAAGTQGTRTFEAVRIAGAWTESAVTWNNFMVGTTGAPATTTNGTGWREWNVQSQVQAWYDTGNNYGFLIKDSVEDADPAVATTIHSRENTNVPELVVTFG